MDCQTLKNKDINGDSMRIRINLNSKAYSNNENTDDTNHSQSTNGISENKIVLGAEGVFKKYEGKPKS